jgi:FMN phosphatase YigB (HAD superfamily)
MPVRRVSTLILDLDNTLFDWLEMWHERFVVLRNTLIGELRDEANVDREIRRIHQKHGTSEYEFLLEEILGRRPFATVVPASNELHWSLYPSVLDSLRRIKGRGSKIVGCTESMERYTIQRLARLELDGVIDIVFCKPDHISYSMPASKPSMPLLHTLVEQLQRGKSKPDPEILLDVMHRVRADAATTAYVGDSWARDIKMAQAAGVLGLHARYGDTTGRPEFNLLKRVSHWSDSEVEMAETSAAGVEDPLVLGDRFDEIFDSLDFVSFDPAKIERRMSSK